MAGSTGEQAQRYQSEEQQTDSIDGYGGHNIDDVKKRQEKMWCS